MNPAAQQKPAILRWIGVLCLSLACNGPRISATEVEIDSGKSDDGSFYQLSFAAEAGYGYTVQSSSDMVSWQDDALFGGIGSQITWNLAELPQPDGSTPITDALPPGYAPAPQVSVQVEPISWDVGTVLRWSSLVDGSPKVHVLDGQNLHPWMGAVTALATPDYHFLVNLGAGLLANDVPYSDPLSGADAAVVSAFSAAMPDLYQQVENGTASAENMPPVPAIAATGRRFFRVRQEDVDADGDGTLDQIEAGQGWSWFTGDTDGDGLPDGADATPTGNDAVMDPDGGGLPPDLETGLIARWDFESLPTTAPFGFSSVPLAAGPLVPEEGAGLLPFEGVVSHSVDMLNTGGTALVAPWQLVNGQGVNTFAMWIKLPLNALLVNWFGMDILGIGRAFGPGEVQVPMFRAWITPGETLRLESNWVSYPELTVLGEWPLPSDLDDGAWHQLVIAKGPGRYLAYVDGIPLGDSIESNLVIFQLLSRPYFYIGQGFPVTGGSTGFRGQIDRFRLYSRVISDEEVLALYNQDIDHDGLFDRIEGATAYWQDLDGDGERSLRTFRVGPNFELIWVSEEETFLINPFRWDPSYADHDGDGVSSLDEQNIHETDPADPAS